jgi:glycosyltransferase involved in cell wall biosynthesis
LSVFLPSLAGGGAEKSMLVLAHGLAERGHSVDLVLARATGPYLPLVKGSVRVVDLNASRVARSLPALVRYLRRERPDTLVSVLDYANIVALLARRLARVPTRIVVNDQNILSLTARHSRQWRQRVVLRLVRHCYSWADQIVGNSRGVADDLSRVAGVPADRIRVIYNPVVTPELHRQVEAVPDHPWFDADQPPVILAVGRLTAQKDFTTLIRAFAEVRRRRRSRLVILGEGTDRPALETLVRRLGLQSDVSLPGFVDNPCSYMARAVLFVLSSRWEGLPTVLIEALFCGVPVVSADCNSGPREILADGRYGALVPIEDPSSLADSMTMALDGRTPRPATDSWRPYDAQTVVTQYLDLLSPA